MTDREKRVQSLVSSIPELTDGQVYWLNRVIDIFECPHKFEVLTSGFFDEESLMNFGDALRIHHSFSTESFSKDKFEYVFEKVMRMSGHTAQCAGRKQKGHDIIVDGVKISLKTQADKAIKKNKIWISKFHELGKGLWGDDEDVLDVNLQKFLTHLKGYERIFTLRTLSREPNWKYELVEIPKGLLELAEHGELEMMHDSTQDNKPGYCKVYGENRKLLFQLYFDGGGERKLQVQHLLKEECVVHATWEFTVEEELA